MLNLKYCTEYKDMYNIYNLITKIDKNYKLYFNSFSGEFFITNTAKNNQICLKFKDFSLNILKILQQSRIENINAIMKDIDEYNDNLLNKNRKNLTENLVNKMFETRNLTKRVSKISQNDINKILGEKIC